MASGVMESAGILMDAVTALPRSDASGCAVIDLRLALPGGSISIDLATPDRPMRLRELLPTARFLCSQIMHIAARHAVAQGGTIPCRKGCSACCRYLVPLTAPEAMWLFDEVQAMDEPQRRWVDRAFGVAARRIISSGPLPDLSGEDAHDADASNKVSLWYRGLNLRCPFLRGDACMFHSRRPLACREHLALSSASDCANPSAAAGRKLLPPISLVNCLAEMSAELHHKPVESVMLPLSLEWARTHRARFRQTWPAPMLVKMLAQKVTGSIRKN